MWPFKKKKLPYADADRLADVMAMIQVLALHKNAHRSNEGLRVNMQGLPRSAASWSEIALQHPEFFRIDEEHKRGISLVARHVMPKGEYEEQELKSDFVGRLLQAAIELHDRQLKRAWHWNIYLPIVSTVIGAVIAGAFLILGVFLGTWVGKP